MSRDVWNDSFNFPLHLLDLAEDGVQTALSILLTLSLHEQNLLHFLFISWYIWRAHIDFNFQRRKWSSHQVLHAAQAHMNIHISA
jgi:hypothetical protein